MRRLAIPLVLVLLAFALPASVAAKGADVYRVHLHELNNSGVTGHATLILRDGHLRVIVVARGLEPGMLHPQHIHGLPGSTDATCPPMSAAGEDGILSLADGLPFYGDVLLPLTPFPMALPNGTISYVQTFHVDGDLTALSDEVIVLHGLTVGGDYVPTLPVACGEIMPVN